MPPKREFEFDKKLMNNPYETILNWADRRLILMGSRAFEYMALQIPSLLLPKIPFLDSSIPTKINFLLIASPGSGKSTLAEMFSQLTINPVKFKSTTGAGLLDEIEGRNRFSLISDDVTVMFKDNIVVKILEGILGEEEEISRRLKNKKIQEKTNGIFTGFGVTNSLSRYLSYGLIQRMSTMMIYHTEEEKEEIADYIASNIGIESKDDTGTQIKEYY